jgi:hypothetical protein
MKFFEQMAFYTIWVGGERPYGRSYLGEIGAERLSDEVVKKYFKINEEDEISFDEELLSEKVNLWDEDEADLPTWNTITEGCMGWGAYTDQYVGVCKVDEENNTLMLQMVDELPWYTPQEIKDGEHYEDDLEGAVAEYEQELFCPDSVWMLYNSCEKGGYSGEFEIPDDEKFCAEKLVLYVKQINEDFEIVVGANYDGVDIEMTGDTDGKGIDWYICYKDQRVGFK